MKIHLTKGASTSAYTVPFSTSATIELGPSKKKREGTTIKLSSKAGKKKRVAS